MTTSKFFDYNWLSSKSNEFENDELFFRKGILLVLIIPLICLSSVAHAQASEFDIELMASAHSPTQPIKQFLRDWEAPLDSGNHAFAQSRTALNVTNKQGINFGLNWRYDYLMEFNEPTSETYWRYKNKQLPESRKVYPLTLNVNHNERLGAHVGFKTNLTSNWLLSTNANLWQGLHIVDGAINGRLTTQPLQNIANAKPSDSINRLDANIDYYYDKPQLQEDNLGWSPDKPNGYGYSLDLKLTGQVTKRTSIEVNAYDILGHMHWHDLPKTQYQLDYDVNGRPLYNLEGQLDTTDAVQKLPWRLESSLVHSVNPNWSIGIHNQVNDITHLYQFSARYNDTYGVWGSEIPVQFEGLIEPQTQSVGFAVDSPYFGMKLLTDNINQNKSKRSEVSIYSRLLW